MPHGCKWTYWGDWGEAAVDCHDVIDPEEAAEYVSIDDDGDYLDENGESGLEEAGVSTGVTEVGTKDVEEVQQAVKYLSLSSYVLRPPSLLT